MSKLLALALFAVSASASARTLVAAEAPEQEQAAPRSQAAARSRDGRLGARLGTAQVGDTQNGSPGVSGAVGYRIGGATLRARRLRRAPTCRCSSNSASSGDARKDLR